MNSLKSLGLKFEHSFSNNSFLENDKSANFDVKDIAKDFSLNFLNLAGNLKLLNPLNKCSVLSVAQCYIQFGMTQKIGLLSTEKDMYLSAPQKLLALTGFQEYF